MIVIIETNYCAVCPKCGADLMLGIEILGCAGSDIPKIEVVGDGPFTCFQGCKIEITDVFISVDEPRCLTSGGFSTAKGILRRYRERIAREKVE